jgi:hypothetical protein
LEKVTGLPLADNMLGSVGKKASSGDLDLAVDQTHTSKEQLIKKLTDWAEKNKKDPKQYVKKSGISVHFLTPISGKEANGFVQTDFMFGDNLEHMKFGLFAAGDASKFSGADRNLLMSSIAKSLPGDIKYSWQKGLIRRSTGESLSQDPDTIAQALLGSGHSQQDLESVESMIDALTPERIQQLKKLSQTLSKSQVPVDSQEHDRINRILAASKK